jgi:hypothetical protein
MNSMWSKDLPSCNISNQGGVLVWQLQLTSQVQMEIPQIPNLYITWAKTTSMKWQLVQWVASLSPMTTIVPSQSMALEEFPIL